MQLQLVAGAERMGAGSCTPALYRKAAQAQDAIRVAAAIYIHTPAAKRELTEKTLRQDSSSATRIRPSIVDHTSIPSHCLAPILERPSVSERTSCCEVIPIPGLSAPPFSRLPRSHRS
jgi:hypothetical protein